MLSYQKPDGNWSKGRWTDTVWTLLVMLDLGIQATDKRLANAFENVAGGLMPSGSEVGPKILGTRMDLCHLGFWLRIGSHFVPQDERLRQILDFVLGVQMGDGGWNCQIRTKPKTRHSSFHTTFNILEGLRPAWQAGLISDETLAASEARAVEFMLQHQM